VLFLKLQKRENEKHEGEEGQKGEADQKVCFLLKLVTEKSRNREVV
jgi:hypothetical protein